MTNKNAILRINNLALDVSIGIYEHEKFLRSVFVNIEAQIPQELANPKQDSIEEVINYEKLVEAAKRAISSQHIYLLETLGHKIADECFKIPQILAVNIAIKKLEPIKAVESVGVEIYRQR